MIYIDTRYEMLWVFIQQISPEMFHWKSYWCMTETAGSSLETQQQHYSNLCALCSSTLGFMLHEYSCEYFWLLLWSLCLNNAQSWCTKYFALQQDMLICVRRETCKEVSKPIKFIHSFQLYKKENKPKKKKKPILLWNVSLFFHASGWV